MIPAILFGPYFWIASFTRWENGIFCWRSLMCPILNPAMEQLAPLVPCEERGRRMIFLWLGR